MKSPRLFTKILFTLIIVLIANEYLLSSQKNCGLMPVPKSITIKEGKFTLDKSFKIYLDTKNIELFNAAYRTIKVITDQTGLFLSKQFPQSKDSLTDNSLIINVKQRVELAYGIDESYQLSIDDNKIILSADNNYGAIHGLSTLTQLINSDESGYYFPCLEIKDMPRFKWRGLLMDVSRHFIPVDVIKRNIDAMAAVKMNVLHWHLTDDHGFRIECKSFPKLHELGSDGLFYTQEEIKEIVKYARERGIRVMPEFDIPGHATSWLVGYPEFASAPGPYSIERNWGIFNPTFDPTNEDTYKFLEKFFSEMASLFPDQYWHIGGDENNGKQWDSNPKIQEYMKQNNLKNNHELQNYFNVRLEKILSKLNKTMVGWYTDEMPDLSKDYVVQAWKGRKTLYETAREGYRSLLSHGFYIDLVQTTEYHYLNDPIPPDSNLTPEVENRIIGGEATMWAEFVGPETVDSRIWPRTAAIAERLWSPSSVNDVNDMYDRLDNISIQLEEYGLTHLKNYEMLMRRITKNNDVEILKNFIDVTNPLYTYSRDHPHVFKSYYPLTRVVDISIPDPKIPREFDQLVETLINSDNIDQNIIGKIKDWLTLWKGNHAKLLPLIKTRPILKEIEPLSEELSKCAEIGFDALEFLNANKKPDEIWVSKAVGILNMAKIPKGEVELTIVKSIEKLVTKAQ